ncbi:hypothetical protein [Serratia symbiotica]|uniref:Uncharacterized protein n=1 Tax=Serratia symbiotica TaxID=138074 RepID=A0A068ZA45_9GAMM|nr:hypothetical protein [Serratia symbiotica]MBF1996224.1 hypothetical protein [Serratia symbiotica]MBQ0954647.1 hypothetical protein [Serratia symbiotica]QLH63696.1 hypothetical protein SYMBAF_13185 [Serratia symbiotica]QTP14085.1 hypothetical protein GPZ83_0012000 [Serratia symbiotica]CDS59070.1 conserved exported hypothetical protein [Serratia symbiotica]
MNIINIKRFLKLSSSMLILNFFLCGCTHLANDTKKGEEYYLEGKIYAKKGDIPINSIATISITQNKSVGEQEFTLLEYNISVKKSSHTIPFRVSLPKDATFLTRKLNISARIENNGDLIMMSDKIIPISYQSDEPLILTVDAS